jgi:4-carboxymuconolactone decarboxylase
MKLSTPRVLPLENSEWNESQKELMERSSAGREPTNIFKTLVRHEKLLKRWLTFASYILGKSTLPGREREIVILRIGWLCQAEYEWAQHVVIGKRVGLTDEEIERITQGPDAAGWSAIDKALLLATDELHDEAFITDNTWAALKAGFSEEQMLDLVFTIGNYNLVSMALNTLGVQLDPGLKGFAPQD